MKKILVGTFARHGYRSKDSQFLISAVTFTLIATVIHISAVRAEGQEGTGMPQLSIKEKIHDFGTAVEGEKVIHDFVLLNRGTSVLQIQKVKTG